MTLTEMMRPSRSKKLHCRDCQKWKHGYCAITCSIKPAGATICAYGMKIVRGEAR